MEFLEVETCKRKGWGSKEPHPSNAPKFRRSSLFAAQGASPGDRVPLRHGLFPLSGFAPYLIPASLVGSLDDVAGDAIRNVVCSRPWRISLKGPGDGRAPCRARQEPTRPVHGPDPGDGWAVTDWRKLLSIYRAVVECQP